MHYFLLHMCGLYVIDLTAYTTKFKLGATQTKCKIKLTVGIPKIQRNK